MRGDCLPERREFYRRGDLAQRLRQIGALGPAFAQTVNVDPNVGVNVNAGVNGGSGNQGVSSGVSANAGGTSANPTPQSGSAAGGVTDKDRGDKETGLNRADQAAGEHGKQGRDNAREKQVERGQSGQGQSGQQGERGQRGSSD